MSGRIGFVWTGIVSRDLNNLLWSGTFNFNRNLQISVITAGDKFHSSAKQNVKSRLINGLLYGVLESEEESDLFGLEYVHEI